MPFVPQLPQETVDETTIEKTSRYNAAAFINIALANMWNSAREHARAGAFHKWNVDLDMIWGELAGDIELNSDKEKQFNKFQSDLADTGSLYPPQVKGFEEHTDNYTGKRAKQYKILLDKHIWLSRLRNTQGKGTAYADADEDLM